ncbi:STAS domain-containing protein [Desulfovibrio gilichinskyi]|uniref:Anti-anti-sigma factor n=1 Tax=Desulfovibrio gilichinskyi TaxID=1519643 RepID=A0A1X7CW60_9BACT|nr:STAS domain-containing protein [Desulfovibrio gilichinskyi]SMF04210.1 anti-anti-sigma factor [Desulfovibrio gilichinskyi]
MTNKHNIKSSNILENRIFSDNLSGQIIGTGHKHDSGESRANLLPFEFFEKKRADSTVLILQGIYNTQTVKYLKTRLYELAGEWDGKLIIDLKKILFIDVACLAAFLKAHKLAESRNGKVVFINRNEKIKRAFQIAKIDSILNIAFSLEEADDLLNGKVHAS